jgi:hypothetical protein
MKFWDKIKTQYPMYNIYNADETGFARLRTKGWFVCPRHSPSPRVTGPDYREHITMMACVSATGRVVPPMFIITGESEQKYHDILSSTTGVSIIATSNIIICFPLYRIDFVCLMC